MNNDDGYHSDSDKGWLAQLELRHTFPNFSIITIKDEQGPFTGGPSRLLLFILKGLALSTTGSA
jgi:hypothetical protein